MRCERARELLSDARYAQGEDLPELRAHVAQCAECRALQDRQVALDRVLALDEPATPRPGFDTRFFARLEREKTRTRRARRLWRGVFALTPIAAAAAAAWVYIMQPPHAAPRPASLPRAEPVQAPDARAAAPAPADTEHAALAFAAEPDDLALAMDLDLVEDMDVVSQLDALEDYDVLSQVDERELERAAKEPN